jgi:hypothetical protein
MCKDKDALEGILEAIGEGAELEAPEATPTEREYFTEPIIMDDGYFGKFIELDEFKEGLRIGAKYAGVYTAMINSGADVAFAQDITFNVQMGDISLANSKVQKEIAEVTSKNVLVATEKTQL